NVDYHPAGAKGGDHRGAGISRWASLAVPSEPDDPLPAWETRMWRQIRMRVAERRAAVSSRRQVDAAPLPAALGAGTPSPATAGEGPGAAPAAPAPAAAGPPPPQRVRPRYRKVGPARFTGTRELSTTSLRAARRARLPVAFSRGHHPLPRLSFGPALPVGVSS